MPAAAEIRAPLTSDGVRDRLGSCWPGWIPGCGCQGRRAQSRLNRDSGPCWDARSRGRCCGGWGKMMGWFGLNITLMVVCVCCRAGIPLWHVLTRGDAELKAEHGGVAARVVVVPVVVQPAPAAAHGTGGLPCAGVAERCGPGRPGIAPGRLGGVSASGSGILPGGTPDTGAPRRKPGSSPEGMRIPSASPPCPGAQWSPSRRGSL
jgi:hypothetical protein